MSNNQDYQVTTTTTSPEPSPEHGEYGNVLMQDAMGLNPNIAEAKMSLMTKDLDGNTTFTVVDFDRSREVKLNIISRNINNEIYDKLATSFDRMVHGDRKEIE